jgi:hypothetical protein
MLLADLKGRGQLMFLEWIASWYQPIQHDSAIRIRHKNAGFVLSRC